MKRAAARILQLVTVFGLVGPLALAQAAVSVAQLEEFVHSKQASRESDADLADQLSGVNLTEELTPSRLARIEQQTRLGPETTEQLRLLAAVSILRAPPADELPSAPAPDAATQQQIVHAALQYVNETLRHLPDFLATRETLSFDDAPQRSPKHAKPRAILHFVGAHRREIAYRNGVESDALQPADSSAPAGLTTWGEFGPVLKTVLGDSFAGSVTWSRWQKGETAAQVAVFRYAVPSRASHYVVDFCCEVFFRGQPGYHGEIAVDLATGAVDRMTLEPDLLGSGSVRAIGIAVQYGHAAIDGVPYVCPIHSVAVSTIRIFDPEAPDGFWPRTYVNEVNFLGYHKFGSTARMVSDSPEGALH
jgi:hypothetical protein